ncbi:MAG: sigma-70 family RNA polymerase sigma factor [Pseudomonadota bacterium]
MLTAEQQLIRQAQAGDQTAFTQLAAQYRERLHRFLWLKSGDRGDAEDATQEALLNAWRYLQSYNEKWQFSTWLYRIGLRQLSRPRAVTGIELEPVVSDNIDAELDSDNVWRTARRCLSADACRAMWLKYAEDASVKEIAEVLDRSQVWVKVNLMRSRQRLARELNERSDQ